MHKTDPRPTMEFCRLTNAEIKAFPPPSDDEECGMDISASGQISETEGAEHAYLADISLHISFTEQRLYEMSIEATSSFVFPNWATNDEAAAYFNEEGFGKAFASIRSMIEGMTAHFINGPIRIPDLEIELEKIS